MLHEQDSGDAGELQQEVKPLPSVAPRGYSRDMSDDEKDPAESLQTQDSTAIPEDALDAVSGAGTAWNMTIA